MFYIWVDLLCNFDFAYDLFCHPRKFYFCLVRSMFYKVYELWVIAKKVLLATRLKRNLFMFSPSNFNFIYISVSFGTMLIYGIEYALNLFCSYDYWSTPELPLICFLFDTFFIICGSKLPNVPESSFGLSDTFSGFAYPVFHQHHIVLITRVL